jgi:bidirectional [NiFe] hydrogenase diaphorase subunit
MHRILSSITNMTATPQDRAMLEEFCDLLKHTSLCGLGQSAPNPVLSTLRFFRNEYTELLHAPEGYVPSGTANEKSIAQ